MKFLLNHRADANAKDNSGNTALMYGMYKQKSDSSINQSIFVNIYERLSWGLLNSWNIHNRSWTTLLSFLLSFYKSICADLKFIGNQILSNIEAICKISLLNNSSTNFKP